MTRVLAVAPALAARVQRAASPPARTPAAPHPAGEAARAAAPPVSTPAPAYGFARIATHAPARPAGRLEIGRADDALEREADRVAGQAVRTVAPPPPVDGGEGGWKGGRSAPRVQPSRVTGGGGGDGVAPPVVHEVLRSPGAPLDAAARAWAEPRLGHDFSRVRVHSDAHAARAARAVGARAFTVGHDVVFGAGEYAPRGQDGLRLLAHELTHTLQQAGGAGVLQRTPCIDERGQGPFEVAIIGAPAPGEISASHPYQFMNAALYHGVGRNTVWIVERTGYEAGGVDTGHVETSVGAGCLIWLTPQNPLPSILDREFPDGSIAAVNLYSHGLAGEVTLRYGWWARGLPNYGLSMGQVRSINSSKFAANATFQFDSCNTGTAVDEGNLAQETAYYTGTTVSAWTGRTSYAEVNDGPGDGDAAVQGSRVSRGYHVDWTEVGSRFRGRDPQLTTFSPPGARVGGFSSSVEIVSRLPESRHFTVPQGGMVVVRCMNGSYERPHRDPTADDRIGIHLHQSNPFLDSHIGHESLAVGTPDIAIFRGLEAGEYYLEIIAESTPVHPYETLESDIEVDVHERR